MAWLDGWSYRKKVTIPAAQVTGTHANFPVYLNLGADSDMLSHVSFLDGRDIRVCDSDETTVLDYELVPDGQYAYHNGAWTWFNGPVARKYDNTYNKTYIAALCQIGTANAFPCVHEINNATGAVVTSRVGDALGERDDHDNPAVCITSTHKIMCAWQAHTGATIYCNVSTNAESVAAWPSATSLAITGATTTTYCNLERLSSEGTGVGRIYNFFRRDSGQWAYIYTDDDGANWTNASPQNFWDGSLSYNYLKCYGNGSNRIDFIATDGHPNEGNKVIYHFYYLSGKWYNSDGTEMTENNDEETALSLPIDSGDLNASSTVFSDATDTAWLWDVYHDGTTVHILYSRFPSDSTANHDYYYVKYSSGWSAVKLCDAGTYLFSSEGYYSGGMCFAPGDATTIYLAKEEGETPIYEIQKYITANAGAAWAKATSDTASNKGDITSGSTYDNFRPMAVRGASSTDKVQMAWVGSGAYTSYTDFSTAIRLYPGRKTRWEHCWAEVTDTIGSGDVDIFVYYGNTSAADAQDANGVWDADYKMVCHGHRSLLNAAVLPDSTSNAVNGTFTPDATNNYDRDYTHYQTGLTLPQAGINYPTGNTTDYVSWSTTISFANSQALAAECWYYWDAIDSNECTLLNNWDGATKANILWRMEPTGNAVEAFVARQTDTQEGGSVSTISATQDAWHYGAMLFDYDATDNKDIIGRVDQTEGTYTCSSSAAMDATASGEMRFGLLPGGTDAFRGYASEFRITNGALRSKDLTDTQYDNIADYATFLTWDAEAAVAGGIPEGYANLSAVGDIAAAGYTEHSGSAALSAVASLAAVGYRESVGTAELAVVASVDAVGYAESAAAASLDAVASISAIGYATHSGATELAAIGGITAAGYAEAYASAELSAVAGLTAVGESPSAIPDGYAALTAEADLAAVGYAERSGSAEMQAVASLEAAGYAEASGHAAMEAVASLAVVGEAPAVATADGYAVLDAIAEMAVVGYAEACGWAELSAVADIAAVGVSFIQVDSWIVEALQAHVPGIMAGQVHIPGAEALDGHGQ